MKSVLRIILLLLISISAFSQGICDLKSTDGIEIGDFDLPATVCNGQIVDAKDKSGGTSIKYIFGYSGQPASAISGIPSKDGPNAQWSFLLPPSVSSADYIVLQYGKKNGKDMYSCKVVNVRDSNRPDVSYEACNGNTVSITIRNTPVNNFSSYKVKWSDGVVVNVPGTATLPVTVSKTFPVPTPTQSVLVEGSGSSLTGCPAAAPMTIAMDRGEMFPRIEKIDLNEEGTEATITLKGNPDAEYSIFSRSIDRPGNLANPLPNKVKSGTFKVSVTDKTKSQCFLVGRVGTICQEYSNEVCTMPFKLEAVEQENKLTWNGLVTGPILNTAAYTHITRIETKIVREENGTNTTTFNSPASPFTDNTADCSKKYCYTLSAKVTSTYNNYTDAKYIETATVSQTQCIDRKNVVPTALTETVATVKDDNTVTINFTDNSTWKLDREKYRLHRLENNKFGKIDSIASTAPKAFLDAAVNPSKESYCYAVDFIDKCESISALSPPFCTVWLSEGNKGELVWTDETPFGDSGIGIFEVQSYDEHTGAISTVVSLSASQIKYTPDLKGFDEEAKFRIKITSPNGTESYSNTYTLPVLVKILLPDAFTPNNDAINDNLEIKGTFKRIANFDFQIYNRWGSPIFVSDDPLKSWDGNFQGTSAPVDTYTYKIYAKLVDGTEINKSGKFMLIR
ncbi:T9SS type B sorting domain-containing protein [Emticicia fontis]